MRRTSLLLLLLPLALQADDSLNAPAPDGIRPGGTLSQSAEAPAIAEPYTRMSRPTRNYPDQPPVIPHAIRGYQVDNNFNQCLSCHDRTNTQVSGAPMVSITHFEDREGQKLAAVSPRRYFCLQCHVPQHQVEPVTISTFKTMDEVLEEAIYRDKSK